MMKEINCRSCGAVINDFESFECAYCGTVDEKSKREAFKAQSDIHDAQLRKQHEEEQLKKKEQVDAELSKRAGVFHYLFCAFKSFVYALIFCEIISFIANGGFSLVNLELFAYWDEFDYPVMIVVVFCVAWLISFFVVAVRRELKIRAKIEETILK